MKYVVTGSAGFIGKNLMVYLARQSDAEVVGLSRQSTNGNVERALVGADVVFHLAGENRPAQESGFEEGNEHYTEMICKVCAQQASPPVLIYSSTIKASEETVYGRSKHAAERHVEAYQRNTGARVHVYRLPNVFGKWSKPNYNSAVATFCHNIARDLPVSINDDSARLELVYVDDVVSEFLAAAKGTASKSVRPVYSTTVGQVARDLKQFKADRAALRVAATGSGYIRALHATYLSFLPPQDFSYDVTLHSDQRGQFVEMLKTSDSGQFSYFTINPGQIRGGHYHHTKTEKFMVVRGDAVFRFRHIQSDERYEISCSGRNPVIVETVPGWAHNVANAGQEEVLCLLWANEIFDPLKPDTYSHEL